MNRFKEKVLYTVIVLLLTAGSCLGVKTFVLRADEKNDIKAEDIKIREKGKTLQEKKQVHEDDDLLVITGTDIDVSGKTFNEIKNGMRKEAEKNGGIIGD